MPQAAVREAGASSLPRICQAAGSALSTLSAEPPGWEGRKGSRPEAGPVGISTGEPVCTGKEAFDRTSQWFVLNSNERHAEVKIRISYFSKAALMGASSQYKQWWLQSLAVPIATDKIKRANNGAGTLFRLNSPDFNCQAAGSHMESLNSLFYGMKTCPQ